MLRMRTLCRPFRAEMEPPRRLQVVRLPPITMLLRTVVVRLLPGQPRANRKVLLRRRVARTVRRIPPLLLLALLSVWSDSALSSELRSCSGALRREEASRTLSTPDRSSTITSPCPRVPTRGSTAISWRRGARATVASMTTRISRAESYRYLIFGRDKYAKLTWIGDQSRSLDGSALLTCTNSAVASCF